MQKASKNIMATYYILFYKHIQLILLGEGGQAGGRFRVFGSSIPQIYTLKFNLFTTFTLFEQKIGKYYLEVVLEYVGIVLVHDPVGSQEHLVEAPLRYVQQRVHVVYNTNKNIEHVDDVIYNDSNGIKALF